jgi:hypothetical protein
MIDLTGRQSEETKLRESLEDLKETIKSTYQRKVHERVQGGVAGAGHFGSSFFGTMGLTGLADSIKKKAEAKEMDRQAKESYVQKFQEGNETFTGTTARGIAETQYESNKANPASEEAAIEKKQTDADSLEVQKKSSDDLTALYTISDDYFKAQMKHNEEIKKLFEQIAENGTGGGGSLLGSAAELAGDLAGNKKGGAAGKAAGKAGKLASLASGAGKFAKIGGGALAVGTAAYEGYSDYQAANDKVASGEITQKEGQVEKGKAVGGGVGGAGGALAGAAAGAAIGSVVPVVGTAIGGLIGGAVGYWGGKKAGQAVGGAGVQGYQALTADGKPAAAAAPTEVERGRPTMANDPRIVTPAAEAPSSVWANKTRMPASSALAGAAMAASVAVTPATAAQKIPEAMPSKPAVVAPAPAQASAAAPTGEYDNRSALTGFTKEFLQGIVDGSISGPINKQQAADYLEKIQPGEAGYKKKFMRGKPVVQPSEPLPAEPMAPSSGGDVSAKSTEVSAARESANGSGGQTNNVVSAPVTNVVNNNNTTNDKSSKNSDSTFQKYVDRRYYPTF